MNSRKLFQHLTSMHRTFRVAGSRGCDRRPGQRRLRIESLESRSLLAADITSLALAVGSDSGIAGQAATFTDRITNVVQPVVTGSAFEGNVVTLYADTNNSNALEIGTDVQLGQATLSGTDPTQPATWSIPSTISLNDATYFTAQDGPRLLFAQAYDGLTNPAITGAEVSLSVFLDTAGPQVVSVTYPTTGQSVFLRSGGPSPLTTQLDIDFMDNPVRNAEFVGSSALNGAAALATGNYVLTGATVGAVAITSATMLDYTTVGTAGYTKVQLGLASPLLDDVYTLTLLDNLSDDAGNALDGETTASAGAETIVLPSGNGAPGSDFSASFTVQGGLCLAVQKTTGLQFTDLQGAVPGNDTTVFPFYKASDMLVSGNFADPGTGVADGFSKLAAYGLDGGKYRFLIKNNDGTTRTVVSPVQTTGIPVAGNFDGNAANGDEFGIFGSMRWHLFSNDLATVIKNVNWPVQGLPLVGDFDGDTLPDLATWGAGLFHVAFAANTYSEIDAIVPMGFPGARERPVAGDIDRDGISDLGLWLPDSGVPSTTKPADWYFLPSGGVPLNLRTTPFTPVRYQYGSSIGYPLTGRFLPSALSGVVVPNIIGPQANGPAAVLSVGSAPIVSTAKTTLFNASRGLTVSGTSGDDSFQLTAAAQPNTWVLTVNGTSQTLGATVTTLNLKGLAGANSLQILGTGKSETAEIWPDRAVFRSGNITVIASNFSNTTINGGNGSTDTVRYHDVSGTSWFVVVPNASSMSGANYSTLGLNFARTVVVAAPGTSNIANFFPATTAATVGSSVSSAVVSVADQGIAAQSAFFSQVRIYNPSGTINRTILPTPSWAVPARLLGSTTLGPATSVLYPQAGVSAALLAGTSSKADQAISPALADALLATYGS